VVAMMSFHAAKCCHLVSENVSATRTCSGTRQFLIYFSTFILVRCSFHCDVVTTIL